MINEDETPKPIVKIVDEFLRALESYRVVGRLLASVISLMAEPPSEVMNQIENFVDGKSTRDLGVEHIVLLRSLREHGAFSLFTIQFTRMMISGIVAEWENLLSKLYLEILKNSPNIIEQKNSTIPLKEILQFADLAEVREYAAQKEVENIMSEGTERQIKTLQEKFGIHLFQGCGIENIMEYIARRNLFVHNDGIVNRKYIALIPEDKRSDLTLGKKIGVDPDYFESCCEDVLVVGMILCFSVWFKCFREKVPGKGNLDSACEAQLNQCIFSLIEEKNYKAAVRLADFALHDIKKITLDRTRKMLIVNKAQAQKWLKIADYKQTLQREDWSAAPSEFLACKFALLDEYEKSFAHIRSAVAADSLKARDIETWPVFKELRNWILFEEHFESIFKRPPVKFERAYEDFQKRTVKLRRRKRKNPHAVVRQKKKVH
jgi:hypothetical protein